MSRKRKHRRPRKPPKYNHHADGPRKPLNLSAKVDVAVEIDRLRRGADRAGVPELLAPDEEAFATTPNGNIMAAQQVLDGRRLGATALVDPAAVFDVAHLAMAVHFGTDLSDTGHIPDGERLAWLLDLCGRCGLEVNAAGDTLRFSPAVTRYDQYIVVSLLVIRRLALIGL